MRLLFLILNFLAKRKSGKVIKISAEELKKDQGQSVATILSMVAGVEINGNQSRNGKDFDCTFAEAAITKF
jgi:outer membrane receptor for ferrienterochelin and colicin